MARQSDSYIVSITDKSGQDSSKSFTSEKEARRYANRQYLCEDVQAVSLYEYSGRDDACYCIQCEEKDS